MTAVIELLAALQREPPICMVGSGVSADSPACLPLAPQIVGWVVSELRPPTVSDEEVRAVCDDLPAERVFEAILMIMEWLEIENAGDRITDPWSVLDTGCDNPRSAPITTFGHLLVVYFASQRGCPVVTTNFDCLLENAARQLGLRSHVESEDPVESWKRTPDDPQQVIIWKPHGTITKPHTIRATIERTARLRPALIRVLEDLFRTGPTLVTGYSGRDLDVFPALRACPRTIWVTPERSFGDRLFEQFGGKWFKTKLNPVATEFASQLAASNAVGGELKRVGPLCGTVATQTSALTEFECRRRTKKAIPFRDSERRLLWAVLLVRAHRFKDAVGWLEGYLALDPLPPALAAQARLLLARALDGISRYSLMKSSADIAGRSETARRDKSVRAQAVNLSSRAELMQAWPYIGWRDKDYIKKYWIAVARAYLKRCVVAQYLRCSVHRPPDHATRTQIAAYSARLEAQLQVWEVPHKIINKVPVIGGILNVILSWLIHRISTRARAVGAADISAAAQHALLAFGRIKDRFPSEAMRGYLGDRYMHQALALRSEAEKLLEGNRCDPRDIQRARELLEEALRITCDRMGDALTTLKILIRMKNEGMRSPMNREHVQEWIESIEAKAVSSRNADIVDYLTN